jgi:hypothetical protein
VIGWIVQTPLAIVPTATDHLRFAPGVAVEKPRLSQSQVRLPRLGKLIHTYVLLPQAMGAVCSSQFSEAATHVMFLVHYQMGLSRYCGDRHKGIQEFPNLTIFPMFLGFYRIFLT